jgi:hypothetical protein
MTKVKLKPGDTVRVIGSRRTKIRAVKSSDSYLLRVIGPWLDVTEFETIRS